MRFENAYLPAGGYWTSPFAKWQGSLSSLHTIKFAADVTKIALKQREIDPTAMDALVFGWTIPSKQCFYGGPWLAGLVGAPHATGAMVSQACATGAASIANAAAQVETGGALRLVHGEIQALGVRQDLERNGDGLSPGHVPNLAAGTPALRPRPVSSGG